MQMSQSQFTEIMKDLAEITGKPMTDRTSRTYWHALFNVDGQRLRDAGRVFMAKGKWATINEWLDECGYAQKQTRREQYESYREEKPSEQNDGIRSIDIKAEGSHGDMICFRETFEGPSEVEANLHFSRKERELFANGWHIQETEKLDAMTKPEKNAPAKKLWIRCYWCRKGIPFTPSRKFETPQEGMAAIMELLGIERAKKLIPHAEDYLKGPVSPPVQKPAFPTRGRIETVEVECAHHSISPFNRGAPNLKNEV
jgi:hypothetical protein